MSHPLVARMASPERAERVAALRALPDDPAAVLLLEPLVARLADPERRVVDAAIEAVAALSARAPELLERLRAGLRADDLHARFGCARALARMEPPGPRLWPVLVEALGSEASDVAWTAARMLVDAGRLHAEVLPLLLGLLRSGEPPQVRRMAGFGLRRLAPERPEAARGLLDATRDDDPGVRGAAFAALAGVADAPRCVGERLREASAGDPDGDARRMAAAALRAWERAGARPGP